MKVRGLKYLFQKLCEESVHCAWVVCTRARSHLDYACALRLRAVTLAMNYIPHDNLARPTRGSQLVINSSSWSLSKV